MTEAEKVKAVYDFMAYQFIRTDKGERHIDPTKTIFYETLLSNEYAYRPNETVVLNLLRAKTGVCEHFAAAFAFFLNDMLGIPAYTVHGQTINTEGVVKGHAWNIAIVDGEVYWFDSDLDDSLARRQGALTYRYFMKDTASFSGIGAHLWSDYYVNLANQLERIAQLPKTTLKYQNYPVTLIEPLTEKNGYIFYPFVDLMSCLLADVSLDRETRIMTGKLNGNVIEIPLESPNYWVNGTKLDVAPELLPFIEGDYTYVYLDVVLESLGLSVSWDANTNTISVTD
jgi:hypothetical protein